MTFAWDDEKARDHLIDEIIGEVNMWESSFEGLQLATDQILLRLQHMNANPDGLYTPEDHPKLLAKLNALRATLSEWEALVPGDPNPP